ncbi:MAG: isopentenyl phosphate kinase [Infirmifilum sp.]
MFSVVKIGGSVITDKSKPYTLRENNLDLLSQKVSSALKKGVKLVLVHGGGSFGHPTAAKYDLSSGGISLEKAFGFAETRFWMSYLNLRVIEKLLSAGVPAVGLQTSAVALTENGVIKTLDTSLVEMLIERLTVPVLYGDAVIDTARGVAILSGDDVAAHLAITLQADSLIFVMGSGGVYDKPPGNPQAKLLTEIRPGNMFQVDESGWDVTGGLRHKLECAFSAAEKGIKVSIGGLQYLEEMMLGLEAPYTRVYSG